MHTYQSKYQLEKTGTSFTAWSQVGTQNPVVRNLPHAAPGSCEDGAA